MNTIQSHFELVAKGIEMVNQSSIEAFPRMKFSTTRLVNAQQMHTPENYISIIVCPQLRIMKLAKASGIATKK